jgi:hypothetical protein
MPCLLVDDEGKDQDYYSPTSWMLCTADTKIFDDPLFQTKDVSRPKVDPKIRPWTDDYSNLFQILKKRGDE